MTKFEDTLFDELMREHGPALATVRRTAPRARLAGRPVWLTGGAIAATGATAAGLMLGGGATPAFAVTQNHDGTATVAIHQMSGIGGANAALRALGDRVVVVPVRPGCPAVNSLPPGARPAGKVTTRVGLPVSGGSVTVDATGIPAGDIAVIGVEQTGSMIQLAQALTSGPAPSCISIPENLPGGQVQTHGASPGVRSA